jgi:hypothetical protein
MTRLSASSPIAKPVRGSSGAPHGSAIDSGKHLGRQQELERAAHREALVGAMASSSTPCGVERGHAEAVAADLQLNAAPAWQGSPQMQQQHRANACTSSLL